MRSIQVLTFGNDFSAANLRQYLYPYPTGYPDFPHKNFLKGTKGTNCRFDLRQVCHSIIVEDVCFRPLRVRE